MLEEALAAAAVVQVSAPALERRTWNVTKALRRRRQGDQEANELLHALDPSHDMVAVAASAKTAADQLVLSLSPVERDVVDAVCKLEVVGAVKRSR